MITCLSDAARRFAALLTLCGGLVACAEGGGLSLPGTKDLRQEAALAGGALHLSGPEGWCVEPRSLRNTSQSSFALIAGCREVAQYDAYDSAPRGYATVVVGPFQSAPVPAEDLLGEVMASDAGGVSVDADGLALVQLAGTADSPAWRGAFTRAGWPVMVAVYTADGSLAGDAGAALVRDIAEGVKVDAKDTLRTAEPDT